MRRFSRRATTAFIGLVVVLAAGGAGLAQVRSRPLPSSPPAKSAPPGPAPATDAGPTLRIGALLPLSGASAWYGKEMRQGMELAVAELTPAGKTPEIKGPEGKPADSKTGETGTPRTKTPDTKAPEGKTSDATTKTPEAGRDATTSPRVSAAPTGSS